MTEFTLTQTPAHGELSTLAFHDADTCARWLRTLPVGNIGQYYGAMYGQLKRLSEADFAPRERARIAEVFREPVSYLHTELARRYAGKPQPAAEREAQANDQAIALWQALWEQYSSCLKPLLEGDPELSGVRAKILQRGLYVGKQMVLVYALGRRVPPPSIWQELHAYYRLAEILDCTMSAVTDDLVPAAIGVSCYSTYVHALLLGLADPCAMSVRQIELADRWLAMWSRKIFPYAQQRESEGPLLLIDLDSASGALLAPMAPRMPPESMRFGYPAKLATSVRGRLKRLHTGANPAELQLGHDVSVESCSALLSHLDSRWHTLPRRAKAEVHADVQLCAGGLGAAYFRLSGHTFTRHDPADRITYQGAQHLATLAALTDYDRNREDAEKSWRWEPWSGTFDSDDAVLRRAGVGEHRWHLDEIAIVRSENELRCGHVTRVSLEQNALSLSIRLWPGTPAPMVLRALTTALSEDPPVPAVILGAVQDAPSVLVLPPRTFTSDRIVRSLVTSGPERRFRLTRLLQRGADFERVAFDEVTA